MSPEPWIRNQAFNKWFECGKFNLDDLNWIGGQLNLVPSLSFGNKSKKEGEKEAKKVFKIALGTRSVGSLLSGDFITECQFTRHKNEEGFRFKSNSGLTQVLLFQNSLLLCFVMWGVWSSQKYLLNCP